MRAAPAIGMGRGAASFVAILLSCCQTESGSGSAPTDAGGKRPAPLTQGVGQPCQSDQDCPTGEERALVCILPTSSAEFGSGSPQDGYCSAPCAESLDCTSLDALSTCVALAGQRGSFCLATCQPGESEPDALRIKCGSDRAQACTLLNASEPAGTCQPRCQSDARCGVGLFCDPGASGLCTGSPPSGAGIGAACQPESATRDCQSGICLEFRDALGGVAGRACSASCTFGSSDGCGYDAQTGGPREFACLQPREAGGGQGDLGLCFELCDFDSDCAREGWACRPLAGAEPVLGRVGECVPATLVDRSRSAAD